MSVDMPNMPPFTTNPAKARGKSQMFTYRKGKRTIDGPKGSYLSGTSPIPEINDPKSEMLPDVPNEYKITSPYRGHEGMVSEQRELYNKTYHPKKVHIPPPEERPAHLKYDLYGHHGQILSFKAYFREAVYESALETERIRLCDILFYRDDDTIEIVEHREDNSAIPQGNFLRRQKVPRKHDGYALPSRGNDFITLNDFEVGEEIEIYSRRYHIVDCDPKTRAELEKAGKPQREPEEVPFDKYIDETRLMDTTLNTGKFDVNRGKKISSMKMYMESKLGREVNSTLTRKEFMDNDRRVLRFWCYWDDRKELHGDLMRYELNFFLSDQTIKIVEQPTINNGRDPFPCLLVRQKVSKDWNKYIGLSLERNWENPDVGDRFYADKDLYIGAVITILNRPMILVACDAYTKKYYMKHYGMKEEEFKEIDMALRPKQLAKGQPAEWGGEFSSTCIGTEEDSKASCMNLYPKPPKKDEWKLLVNDTKVLRFKAYEIHSNPIERTREFLVSYYLADDTIQVFEEEKRNSGITGGKFIQRRKIRRPDGQYYKPEEFFVGAELNLYSRKFKLTKADAYTIMYMMSKPETYPYSDFMRIAKTINEAFLNQNEDPVDLFRKIDTDNSGAIDETELKNILNKIMGKKAPNDHELATLMMSFDCDMDNLIQYEEFLQWLEHPIFKAKMTQIIEPVMQEKFETQYNPTKENAPVMKGLQLLCTSYISRKHELDRILKKVNDDHSGFILKEEFVKGLNLANRSADFVLKNEDISNISEYMFPAECRSVGISDFLKLLWRME